VINNESILPPKWVLVSVLFIGVIWIALELKEIVTLIIVGYCLAYLLNPVVTYLEKNRIPRSLGTILTFVILIVSTVILFSTAVPTLVNDYDELTKKFPDYAHKIASYVNPLIIKVKELLPIPADLTEIDSISGMFSLIDMSWVNKILSGAFGALLKGYSITLTILNLILLPFITFYLTVDFPKMHREALDLVGPRNKEKVSQIVGEIDFYVSSFVRGQLLVGLILAVLYSIGLGLIGIELWFLLALISGFGNIVPYLGFLLGIVGSSIMALLTFGEFLPILYVIGVFVIVQSLEGMLITPKVIGDKVGISPLVVILAILAAGKLFGFLGIFLAVPGTAILKVLAKHLHEWILVSQKVEVG